MIKKVCGIQLKGKDAILIMLEGTKTNYNIIHKKISINDDVNQNDIKSFKNTLDTFFNTNIVDIIGIKKRATKGGYISSPVSYKIEGIIQLLELEVKLISPQSIASKKKRYNPTYDNIPYKYQIEAFETAYYLLEDD